MDGSKKTPPASPIPSSRPHQDAPASSSSTPTGKDRKGRHVQHHPIKHPIKDTHTSSPTQDSHNSSPLIGDIHSLSPSVEDIQKVDLGQPQIRSQFEDTHKSAIQPIEDSHSSSIPIEDSHNLSPRSLSERDIQSTTSPSVIAPSHQRPTLKDICQHSKPMVERELYRLQSMMPSVDLFQAYTFLAAVEALVITDSEQATTFLPFRDELLQHFADTRQSGSLKALRNRITLRVLTEIRPSIKQLKQATASKASGLSLLIDHMEEIIYGPGSFTGDQPELINNDMERLLIRLQEAEPHNKRLAKMHALMTSKRQQAIKTAMLHPSFQAMEKQLENFATEAIAADLTQINTQYAELEKRQLEITKLQQQMHEHPEEQTRLSLETLTAELKKARQQYDQLLQAKRPVLNALVQGMAERHRLQATLGGQWNMPDLAHHTDTDLRFHKMHETLAQWSTLKTPALGDVQLAQIQAQHNQVPHHPKVVIEGGGPTGLLQAIKAYQVGADVTLLEKRDTLYNRPQILRLDAQWLNDLRFYLSAEQYDALFDTTNTGQPNTEPEHYNHGTGYLSTTGAGHILTHKLEETLHTRLSEMISLEQQSLGQKNHLQRLAAHQVTGVEPPAKNKNHYQVVYEYQPKYDPAQPQTSASEIKRLEADVVIVAGGRSSTLRQQFFNPAVATVSSNYGVASWTNTHRSDRTPAEAENIQQMLVMDTPFLDRYHNQLLESLNPVTGHVGASLSANARTALIDILQINDKALTTLTEQLSEQDATEDKALLTDLHAASQTLSDEGIASSLERTKGKLCQLRAFENRNTNYLGMEIPAAIDDWFQHTEKTLQNTPNISAQERKVILQLVKELWFQSVADHKGLSERYNAHFESLDHKFTTTFPVAQETLGQNYSWLQQDKNDNGLLILPIGDAAATPHFMSASGLSGGRATVDIATDYIAFAASGRLANQQAQIIGAVDQAVAGVADYVLGKGKEYLQPIQPETVEAIRRQQTLQSLQKEAQDQSSPYKIRFRKNGKSLILSHKNTKYELTVDHKGSIIAKTGRPPLSTSHPTFQHLVLTKLLTS